MKYNAYIFAPNRVPAEDTRYVPQENDIIVYFIESPMQGNGAVDLFDDLRRRHGATPIYFNTAWVQWRNRRWLRVAVSETHTCALCNNPFVEGSDALTAHPFGQSVAHVGCVDDWEYAQAIEWAQSDEEMES